MLLLCAQQVLGVASIDADVDKLMPLSLIELIRVPVVTASRQPETRDQTPSHIVVVTQQQIRERRYKNLADLLEDMPGVDFMRGTKSSQYNQFTVQGYIGPNELVIMLDGIRIGHPAGGNIPVADNLALYHAKQVEIVYGPAAALYGADAVAGVVNIITEHAGERDGAWVSVGGGNFGSQESAFMAGAKGGEGLALSVGDHAQQSDRAPLNEYYRSEFAKKNATTFSGQVVIPAALREDYVGEMGSRSLFARVDAGKDLTLGFYRNVFRSLTSTGDPPATALYLSGSRWITQTDTFYGKYRFDVTPNLSGELVIDYANMEVDPQARYVNIYNNFIPGHSYVRGERKGIEQNFNWRLNEVHRIQAGVGHQKYYAIEVASLPTPYDTDKSPGKQGFNYINTTLPQKIQAASFINTSAYAQIQSEWSPRFSTMAGVRIDHHSNYGAATNPRVGAIWRLDDQHVLKALYGEAFRAPSTEESLSSFGIFDGAKDSQGRYIGTSFRIPNANLEPEKARTFSLTWDWRPRPDLNFVANAYRSQIHNLIVTQASTAVDAIPGAILINPETKGNAGKQTHAGIDLMSQWRVQLGHAWSADLWGSASWVQGKIDQGNGQEWDISLVAAQKVKLGTTFRYLDRFTLTPQVLWIGDTSNGRRSAQPPDRLITPGYTLTNLHAGWHKLLDGKATVWLDIYNLLDERYYAAHGSASRTFFDMPQQPRRWMASLDYRF